MISDPKLGIQEIVFAASTVIALVGQWFLLNERVDLLEHKLIYYKEEILDNSAYRDDNMVLDAEQEVRIQHLEDQE